MWIEVFKIHGSLKRSIMLGMVEGRRGRGRPFMCWMDGLTDATKLSMPELQEALQDRDVWRNLIINVTKSGIHVESLEKF